MAILRDVDDYVGKYYSHEYVRRKILHQSDEEIEEINNQIADEANDPQYQPQTQPPAEGGDGSPGQEITPPPQQ